MVLGTIFSVVLWFSFGTHAHWSFFLIPFFWVVYVRSVNSRIEELNDRLITTMDLLVGVLQEHDPEFDIRDYFENNGIDDDDDFV